MAYLVLEDGKVFPGEAFGAQGVSAGQLVFNTCMTGYQEVLTDPANYGNIVTMTYPEIGNVGINAADAESDKPQIAGLVIRQVSPITSNFRCEQTLEEYLKAHNVAAIKGVDTRAVAKHLRDFGPKYAVIACGERLSVSDLIAQAQRAAAIANGADPDCRRNGGEGCACHKEHEHGESCHCHEEGHEHDEDCCCNDGVNLEAFPNLTEKVTCKTPYKWTEKNSWIEDRPAKKRYNVVVLDLGVRRNQLRDLVSFGCDVTVVPSSTTAEEILALKPDGVFISNGPGAPWAGKIIENTVEKLTDKVPVCGIGLGSLMLGMSLGINPCILEHGNHGVNIPVQNAQDGTVAIVSKNIDYALDGEDFQQEADDNPLFAEITITHTNLNFPEVIEGFRHNKLPIIGISWNPAVPTRPQDGRTFYDDFIDLMN